METELDVLNISFASTGSVEFDFENSFSLGKFRLIDTLCDSEELEFERCQKLYTVYTCLISILCNYFL